MRVKILSLMLAVMMVITSVGPVYANEGGSELSGQSESVATFNTVDGSIVFEAEAATLNGSYAVEKEDTNASGGKAVEMTNNNLSVMFHSLKVGEGENDATQFDSKGNPIASVESGINVNIVPDKAGTYYVWVRILWNGYNQPSAWYSSDEGGYFYEAIPIDPATEYRWVKLTLTKAYDNDNLIVSDEEVGKEINIRFRACKIGMVWDKFLITTDANYTPEGTNPTLPGSGGSSDPTQPTETPTFETIKGSVMFEAEDTKLHADYTDLVTGETTAISGGKAVQLTNEPDGNKMFISTKYQDNLEQFGGVLNGNPISSVEGGISFNIVPDIVGTYYVWVRLLWNSDGTPSVWGSIDNEKYIWQQVNATKTADCQWVKLGSIKATVSNDKIGEEINMRFRGCKMGVAFDKILITTDATFAPEGMDPTLPDGDALKVRDLPSDVYTIPTITPTVGEHPRLMFTASDVATIRTNLTHAENAEAYAMFLELKEKACDGVLSAAQTHNYNAEYLAIIEAKAFDYVINGNEENGKAAITAIKNYLTTYNSPDAGTYYSHAGHAIFTAAEVYDWCYNLLSADDKLEITARCQLVGELYMSIGFPPSGLGAITGHGSEAQLLRDWLSIAIATYDEYPSIYNYVAGRYFEEYVPARDYYYTSGGHYQGNYYGPYRFTWDLWAQTFISNMSKADNVGTVYTAETQQVLYQWIYARRPDGEFLREGDDAAERYADASRWYKYTNYPFFLASNFYGDSTLKGEFLAHKTLLNDQNNLSSVQMLALNNPTIETQNVSTLPLTKYIDSPIGAMYARTGWNMGIDSPDVLAYMKIGEIWPGNHVHRDAGNFQIYYKGILASESGEYHDYLDSHMEYYNASSVAHNTLSITSTANPTGVQRKPNNLNQYKTLEQLNEDIEDCTTGEVTGQEYGPDIYTPEYSYIAGDIADAYDDNVQEAVRSMLFMPLEDEDHPAAFVVFDRITTTEASSTKTFMLHMQTEPTIEGNVTVITNNEKDYNGTYNGMLTNQTLLPTNASITKLGGEGHRFEVGGVNYEPNFRYGEEGMEEGWGRVEISTTTTEANQTDYFLNVMYVNDADKTLALEEAELIYGSAGSTENAVIGAKVFNRVAMFNTTKARTGEAVTFVIPEDADVVSYKVNVAGLQDGTWTITTSDNQTQTAIASEDGGIIYFSAPAGTCTITRTGEANDKDFTENKPQETTGLDLRVNDSYIYTAAKAVKEGEELYLPVKVLFETLGADITETTDKVSIDYLGNAIQITSTKAVIVTLGSTVETTAVKVEGTEYLLPASILIEALSEYMEVKLDEISSVVDVKAKIVPDWSETYPDAIQVKRAYQLDNTEATSSIWNALDGNFDTYWGAEGQNRTELGKFDLGQVYALDQIMVAFHQANKRTTSFDIAVSLDDVTYTPLTGTKTSTEGIELNKLEGFDLGDVEARYVKLYGYGFVKNGNTGTGVWNSIKEIVFRGELVPTIIKENTYTEYTRGSNGTVTIHCNVPHDELVAVKTDGEVVDESNYSVRQGSTIVEFSSAYLETLSVGEHEVILCYTNNRSTKPIQLIIEAATPVPTPTVAPTATPTAAPTATPTITPTATPAPTATPEQTEAPDEGEADDDVAEVEDTTSNPDSTVAAAPTGDNSNLTLWSLMLILALAASITAGILFNKKIRKTI